MFFTPPTLPPPAKPITVWVHGTRSNAFLPTKISKTFSRNELLVRYVCPGLTPACSMDKKFYTPRMANILCESDSALFDFDNFYLFGWSGELDSKDRKRAGAQLYSQLKGTIRDYQKKYNQTPPVTIITHSHGGNVALNMAHAYKEDTDPITIDRLVLLACPVQTKTADHANCPLFKKVYSLHSHGDYLQRMDVQKLHNFGYAIKHAWQKKSFEPLKKWWLKNRNLRVFSERHFQPHEHIKQVSISWQSHTPWNKQDCEIFASYQNVASSIGKVLNPKHRILHIEFILPSFMKQLSPIIKIADETPAPLDPKNPDIIIKL